jgi:glycerate kinase
MSVVVAPTAFKGTLGPVEVARALAAGVQAVWPGCRIERRPLSDGGNGLLEACWELEPGVLEEHRASGPLGVPVGARILRQGSRCVIESAEACGLHLLREAERDPLVTTSRGVGELVLAALAGGASELILGLGGSATVDGGTGMARALGWGFVDAAHRPLAEGGGSLGQLARILTPRRPIEARVVALCDVDNPLTGALGAARVYAPQKGAGPDQVAALEVGLARLAHVLQADLGLDVAASAGAGAAGGLGAGAHAFLGAALVSGSAWMMERTGLASLLPGADLVVTGEGRFDAQSGMGKATGRVLEAALAAGVPALLVCGRIEGALPAGVEAVEGRGRTLGVGELTELCAAACRALADRGRLGPSGKQGRSHRED